MSSLVAGQHYMSEDLLARSAYSTSIDSRFPHEKSHGQISSSWFAGGLPTPPTARTMSGATVNPTYSQTNHPPSLQTQHPPEVHAYSALSTSHSNSSMYSKANSQNGDEMSQTNKRKENIIAAYLQIPESVNKSKGSLAEFAAEISCLFWFETAETLQVAENLPTNALPDRGLHPDATPSTGFRKWVTTILSTTQVGKNVILLALMFIYRLKKFNPTVSGKKGSEFRLLTIALMLGNKFLDDNTYTNKTWAEVSGISVTEIHIMEVEFLSNMRYDLYVSEEEWLDWKQTLGRLGSFYEKASKLPYTNISGPITPTGQSFPHKLPSPPSTHHTSGGHLSAGPSPQSYSALPNPLANVPQLPHSPLRHQRVSSVDPLEHRKRTLDHGSEMPPAKRTHYGSMSTGSAGSLLTPTSYTSNGSGTASVPPMASAHDSTMSGDVPRLPLLRMQPSIPSMESNQLAPLNLPANRAMSSVYPVTTTAAWSQPITPVSAGSTNLYQAPIPNLGDLSRPQSNIGSRHTSPNGFSTTPVLPGLSPSYFLTHRTSPYRPVRHVNTLLIPPPSAALQNPVRTVPHEQIYHQPLSKAVMDRRPGPLPYQSDWHHQSNVSTPLSQKYPYRI